MSERYYDGSKLDDLGYGYSTRIAVMTPEEVQALANCVDTGATDEIETCEVALYGSDDAKRMTPETLGVDEAEYVRLLAESLESAQAEGHVRASTGARVYAL